MTKKKKRGERLFQNLLCVCSGCWRGLDAQSGLRREKRCGAIDLQQRDESGSKDETEDLAC